jgi:hypothetical protein
MEVLNIVEGPGLFSSFVPLYIYIYIYIYILKRINLLAEHIFWEMGMAAKLSMVGSVMSFIF